LHSFNHLLRSNSLIVILILGRLDHVDEVLAINTFGAFIAIPVPLLRLAVTGLDVVPGLYYVVLGVGDNGVCIVVTARVRVGRAFVLFLEFLSEVED
jgi:hypothetical protein